MNETPDNWRTGEFFSTTPLTPVFKKLHAAKADLKYVFWLCQIFFLWDHFWETQQLRRQQKQKKAKAAPDVEPDDNKSLLLFASNLIESTLKYLQEHGHVDGTLDTLTLIPSEARRKLIADTATYTSGVDLWGPFLKAVREAHNQHLRELREEEDEREKEELERVPFLKVVKEYRPIQKEKGRKPDPWGSFFLLAVTQHLREKSKKPHYLTAATLLEILRGLSTGARLIKQGKYHKRKNADEKIRKLKKAHRKWASHLKSAKHTFQKAMKSAANSSPVSPPSWYPKNLLGQ